MFERRDVLKLGLGGLAAGSRPFVLARACRRQRRGRARAATGPACRHKVSRSARRRLSIRALSPTPPATAAKQPYKALPSDLPDPLRKLTYDQYVAIRAKPCAIIWANENFGFALEPLHRGFIFSTPVAINLVSQGQARRVDLRYGAIRLRQASPCRQCRRHRLFRLSRSGAAKRTRALRKSRPFRARASFGPSPRASVSARWRAPCRSRPPTRAARNFRRSAASGSNSPNLATDALVIHAFIDSESMTGAYRFTLHPGDATIIDTECTLFARAKVDNFGLATMSATVLSDADRSSPARRYAPDDRRHRRSADVDRPRRMALAPGLQPRDLADLDLRR